MAPAWHSWVNDQIEQLQAQDLLRSLKPLIPGHSAVEVPFISIGGGAARTQYI